MNRKALIGLGAVALIIAVLAVMTAKKDSDTTTTSTTTTTVAKDEPVLPALKKQINDVAKIHIEDGSTSLTLTKTGETWGMENKYNYPIKFDQVKKLVVDLSNLTKSEEKTSNASSYGRMEVEDVAKGAKSKEVTLYDSGGKKIGGVILGKNYFPPGGGDKQHQYVRVAGDKQSWLADGSVNAATDAPSWLDTELFSVPNSRIQRIVIQHKEGENVTVSKAAESDANYKLETIPTGREIASEGRANELASILSGLRFDEVLPASAIDTAAATPVVTATVETFDGLSVTAKTFDKDKKQYTQFHAEVKQDAIDRENARRTAKAATDQAAAQAEKDAAAQAAKKDADTSSTTKMTPASPTETPAPAVVKPDLVDPAKIKEEADKINTQVGPWLFALPSGTLDRLTRKNEFYLKALPKPGDVGPAKPGAAATPATPGAGTYEPDPSSPLGGAGFPPTGMKMLTPAPPSNPMAPQVARTPVMHAVVPTPTETPKPPAPTPTPAATTAAPAK